jgi:coenzyme F420-reducing hydrogenase beta subunit
MHCKGNNLTMKQGMDGFMYPEKGDSRQCECGFVCPEISHVKKSDKPYPHLYALQIKNEGVLLESTSGGAFYCIADYVLQKGGYVCGVVYNDDLQAVHILTNNYDDLTYMHNSKYVKSDLKNVYREIKDKLESNFHVLFSGLPCEVGGLKSFLEKDYDKLITVDLVCTGVPSARMFSDFINSIELKKKIKIIDFKFRDKHKYGLSHTTVIRYIKAGKEKQKTIQNRDCVSYYVAFGKQNCFRDKCYNCSYNSSARVSDFTLGGFWSYSNTGGILNENSGVSLVLSNSDNAENIVKSLNHIAHIEQYDGHGELNSNYGLCHHTPNPNYRYELFDSLNRNGYIKTADKYFKAKGLIKRVASRMLPLPVKIFLTKYRRAIFNRFK